MALNELFEDVKLRAQVAPGDVMSRNSLWQIFAARGEFDRSRTQLDALASLQAQQASTARAGNANRKAFHWLCDGDARQKPCLELMVKGRYFWLPWSRVRAISSREPTEIRDRPPSISA